MVIRVAQLGLNIVVDRKLIVNHYMLKIITFLQIPIKIVAVSILISVILSAPVKADDIAFNKWLLVLIDEARKKGIDNAVLQVTFQNVKPRPRVIELDRSQAEFQEPFWKYLDKRVSTQRISRGTHLLKKNRKLLNRIEQKYGIPGRFLVAFWGLETNFGSYMGPFPVIESLVTLAFDRRRSSFFRSELFHALAIIQNQGLSVNEMRGSWAGAIGHTQFMPSTFVKYGQDGDLNGTIDLWRSLPDVFASSANYLDQMGWSEGYTWGREILLPPNFDYSMSGLKISQKIEFWRGQSIYSIDGGVLPTVDITASVVVPNGSKGPAFLVYNNFRIIMHWNNSISYALSVGHLADRIIAMPPLKSKRYRIDTLSREEIVSLQIYLNSTGYNSGEPDGTIGPMTNSAVMKFQSNKGMISDGYPDRVLFNSIFLN